MRLDTIGTVNFDRVNGVNQTLKLNKGKVNGIIAVANNFSFNDTLSVKVKGEEGNQVLMNRMNFKKLGFLSDLKNGYRGYAGIQDVIKRIVDVDQVDFNAIDNTLSTWYGGFALNTVYIPLGSINTSRTEVELNFDSKATAASNVTYTFYQVLNDDQPDTWLIYDETQDFTEKHSAVRNVFFYSNTPIIDRLGEFAEVDFQLDLPDDSQIFNSTAAVAYTNLFNRVESMPELQMLEIYRDTFPVPTNMRIKVSGQTADDSLIIIREYVPKSVSDSTIDSLEKLTERVKQIEKQGGELAKRYRHKGVSEKSEVLEQTKAALENSGSEG